MLSIRLPLNSKLLLVKSLGKDNSYIWIFNCKGIGVLNLFIVQGSTVYVYIKIKNLKKIKEVSCINASKKRKFLEINLTKDVKDLYTENYKTQLKKIKGDLIKL